MNIKKAACLISPEPLLNTRRSSLPLSFDTANGSSPLLDIVKKFNYSPRFPNSANTEGQFHLPQIICESPSPPQVSQQVNKGEASLPKFAKDQGNSTPKERKYLDNYFNRRSSCGAIFSPNSPIENWLQSSLNRRSSDYCRTVSPTLWKNAGEVQEISPKRLPPLLHFPSLSPCFEEKPKQNHFPFSHQNSPILRGDSTNYLKKVFANSCEEDISSKRSPNFRIQSPNFLNVNDRILTPKSKIRRNSFGSTVIPSCSDEIFLQSKLQDGNFKLTNANRSFNLDSVLGKGGFGIVKVECWQGEKVAIKILKDRKSFASIKNEEYSLSFGSHLNLVETKAVVISKDSSKAEIKTSNFKKKNEEICQFSYILATESLPAATGLNETMFSPNSANKWSLIISELCTSDTLLSLINLNIVISDQDKLSFLYQIASALQYMHEKGYVHLDVKPSNCFVSQSGAIKLGDFGCTCKMNDVPSHSLGTVAYQAPEALRGNPVTDRCDIYSLGITTWQLLTRESPYDGQHPHVIIYKVSRMKCRPTTAKEMKTFIENALFSLAEKCWFEVPRERPKIETLISIIQSLYFSSFPITMRGKSLKKSSF